jgi:hypothetical protein
MAIPHATETTTATAEAVPLVEAHTTTNIGVTTNSHVPPTPFVTQKAMQGYATTKGLANVANSATADVRETTGPKTLLRLPVTRDTFEPATAFDRTQAATADNEEPLQPPT